MSQMRHAQGRVHKSQYWGCQMHPAEDKAKLGKPSKMANMSAVMEDLAFDVEEEESLAKEFGYDDAAETEDVSSQVINRYSPISDLQS